MPTLTDFNFSCFVQDAEAPTTQLVGGQPGGGRSSEQLVGGGWFSLAQAFLGWNWTENLRIRLDVIIGFLGTCQTALKARRSLFH